MEAWEVEEAVADHFNREWERMNDPDATTELTIDYAVAADGESLRQGAKSLARAIEELDRAADDVNEAAETLVDTPEGDRVAAILSDMEKLLSDLKALKDGFERGEAA